MKCIMLWHGGASYGMFDSTNPEDVEEFDSMKDAAWAFEKRSWGSQSYYPCVSNDPPDEGGPEGWLLLGYEDAEDFLANGPHGDLYPDRIIRFGARGGVHVDYA